MSRSILLRLRETAFARVIDTVAVASVLAIVVGSIIVQWFTRLNHDVAYFLALSRMVSQGRNLYDDLIDPNTPTITLIGRVSVALAEATGLSVDRIHVVVLSAFLFAAVVLGCVLVRRFAADHPSRFLVFAAAASLAAFVIPASDFGQREHLFAASLCPYLIAIVMHWRGIARRRIEVAAVGALATVGFFLKPYFVVYAAAIWSAEIIAGRGSLRRVSPESWITVVGTASAYSTFLLVEPNYLRFIVPSTAATFLEYREPFLSALGANRAALALVALPLVVGALLVWDDGLRHIRTLVLRLGWPLFVAGVLVIGLQGTGFRYHVLPLRMWGFLLCTVISVQVAAFTFGRKRPQPPPLVRAMAVAGLACTLTASVLFLAGAVRSQYAFTRGQPRSAITNHPFVKVLSLNGPRNYVYLFCTSVIPGGLAFIYADTRWSGHMIPMYLLPILYDYKVQPSLYPRVDPAVIEQVEADERRLIARDFVERTPDLVLFDAGPYKRYFRTRDFDYLAFLKQDRAFRDLWDTYGYSDIGDVQDFTGRPFRVFLRNGSSIDRAELTRLVHPRP